MSIQAFSNALSELSPLAASIAAEQELQPLLPRHAPADDGREWVDWNNDLEAGVLAIETTNPRRIAPVALPMIVGIATLTWLAPSSTTMGLGLGAMATWGGRELVRRNYRAGQIILLTSAVTPVVFICLVKYFI